MERITQSVLFITLPFSTSQLQHRTLVRPHSQLTAATWPMDTMVSVTVAFLLQSPPCATVIGVPLPLVLLLLLVSIFAVLSQLGLFDILE